MALVRLRNPLRQLAGGTGEHELDGSTVLAVLRELERQHPALEGWIVDERGQVRRHINVFVNGERAIGDSAVTGGDRLEIVPAITGG